MVFLFLAFLSVGLCFFEFKSYYRVNFFSVLLIVFGVFGLVKWEEMIGLGIDKIFISVVGG